jgi:CBS domain-containing protein
MASKAASPGRKGDPGRISKLVVNETDTVQAAMLAIDQNSCRSVIVVNDANVVVGTLSDGDIRKSLLEGRLMTTPVHRVMNSDFIALTASEQGRARSIFDETHVFLIPVIDEHGKLLDILTAY